MIVNFSFYIINCKIKPNWCLFYLRKTRMIDVVVGSTKYCSTYGANKNPNREWTVSISVPAITKYTFLCHRITCRAWITRWRCLWIRPCSLFYISSHYRVKVVFGLKKMVNIIINKYLSHNNNYNYRIRHNFYTFTWKNLYFSVITFIQTRFSV